MDAGMTTYFSLVWPILTDAVLICTGLFCAIWLYLVDRQFEEDLIGYERDFSKKKVNVDFVPSPDDEWFLASGFQYRIPGPLQCWRLHALRKMAKFVVFLILAIISLFGAKILFAATTTGKIGVSTIVLSRCLIRISALGGRVESACTEGVASTKTTDKTISVVGAIQNSTQAAAPNKEVTTIMLTY